MLLDVDAQHAQRDVPPAADGGGDYAADEAELHPAKRRRVGDDLEAIFREQSAPAPGNDAMALDESALPAAPAVRLDQGSVLNLPLHGALTMAMLETEYVARMREGMTDKTRKKMKSAYLPDDLCYLCVTGDRSVANDLLFPYYRTSYAALGFDQRMIPYLDEAVDSKPTFLVSTMELLALHQTQQVVEALVNSGYRRDRMHLILNRTPKRPPLSPEEVEKLLGLSLYAVLPDESAELHTCYSEGKLLSGNSQLGKHLGRVASKIAGTEADVKRKYLIFG